MKTLKRNELMGAILDVDWVPLGGKHPGHEVSYSTAYPVTLTRRNIRGTETIVVHYIRFNEFIALIEREETLFPDGVRYELYTTVVNGVNQGVRKHIAECLIEEFMGVRVYEAKHSPFNPSEFSASKPTSIVLGNSDHPVARYGLTAKPIPSVANCYFIDCDGIAVVINPCGGWINKLPSQKELNVAVQNGVDLSVDSIPLKDTNKYIGNDVMSLLASA